LSQSFDFLKKNRTNSGRGRLKTVHRKVAPNSQRPVVMKSKTQQQIDELLDKISRSGYDSLTEAEKSFLFRAGQSETEDKQP
jgi:hypothetical protein